MRTYELEQDGDWWDLVLLEDGVGVAGTSLEGQEGKEVLEQLAEDFLAGR